MMFRVSIKKAPDHALVLSVVFPRLALEKLNAAFAQRDGHLHSFIPEDEVFRTRKEVRNDLEVSEGFVRVRDFLAHKFACLSASSRLRKSE